jgi:hypothetical protein
VALARRVVRGFPDGLMCLAVIGVFLGVGKLLEQDNTPTGTMAAEYKALTERTSHMS